MKKIVISTLFVMAIWPVFSQEIFYATPPSRGEEMEKLSLDMATVRVYYQFTQKEKAKDKSAFRNDRMTLDIGPQMSCYYDETKSQRDSIASLALKNLDPSMIKSIRVFKGDPNGMSDYALGEKNERNYFDGNSETIYKNRINGAITIIDNPSGLFRCEDPVGTLKWEITQDTATIFDTSCQKAKVRFRGRDYVAWFAPEIPINDGPWKFFGLPGLIIRINDTAGLISFECVGLQYLDNPYEIGIPQGKYYKCSRKELEKAVRNRGASMNIINNAGNIVIASKELSPSFQFIELE
jgi:GLPGLI family protein